MSGAIQAFDLYPWVYQNAFSISIPRALVQALRIEKGETIEWVIEGGELVLRRLGKLER